MLKKIKAKSEEEWQKYEREISKIYGSMDSTFSASKDKIKFHRRFKAVLVSEVLIASLAMLSYIFERSYFESFVELFFLFLILGAIIYVSRFSRLKNLRKEIREDVIRKLPDFLNSLILLMDAGFILSQAFSYILNSYDEEKAKQSYFVSQLLNISKNINETNANLVGEFRNFALRTEVRELMRLANIMYDNIDKGTYLSEKLRSEANTLWNTRKKHAEELSTKAESKMSFPLGILLFALIIVTVAPAFLYM